MNSERFRALLSHQGPLVHADHSRRVAPAPTGVCQWSSPCPHAVNVFVATTNGIIRAGDATYHYYRDPPFATTNEYNFLEFKENLQTLMQGMQAGYAFGLTPQTVTDGKVWSWKFHTIAERDGSSLKFDEKTMKTYMKAIKSQKRYEVIFLGNDPKGTDITSAMRIGDWSDELNHVMKA